MNPLEEEEDPWPDEPEEFDPESLGPDPPTVEQPDAAAMEDVSEDAARLFFGAVVMANVALFALSLGAMLVYFRGDWELGGAALAVGAVATLFLGRFYWQFKTRDPETT